MVLTVDLLGQLNETCWPTPREVEMPELLWHNVGRGIQGNRNVGVDILCTTHLAQFPDPVP